MSTTTALETIGHSVGDLTILSDYHARWAEQDREQELVNTAGTTSFALAERLARRFAEERHHALAQYADAWDDWKLGRISRTVETKGGVRFVEGDLVLFSVSYRFMQTEVHAYSVRGMCNVSLRSGDVSEVAR
jgi:hypothetical protein